MIIYCNQIRIQIHEPKSNFQSCPEIVKVGLYLVLGGHHSFQRSPKYFSQFWTLIWEKILMDSAIMADA